MPSEHLKWRDEFLKKLSANPMFEEAEKAGQAYIIIGSETTLLRAW
jgi:hypothetical protein